MLATLTYYIQTVYRWILRCGYCRGFGIQSPSAYSFVRYVINEHYPYYSYRELDEQMKGSSRRFRKIGRLLFRIANYWQPQYGVLEDADFSPFISAGCNHTMIRMVDDYCFEDSSNSVLLVFDINKLEGDMICEHILSSATDKVLLVLIGICASRQSKQLWKRIVEDGRTGVTYDLYYCGIVFFDKSKPKQYFTINF